MEVYLPVENLLADVKKTSKKFIIELTLIAAMRLPYISRLMEASRDPQESENMAMFRVLPFPYVVQETHKLGLHSLIISVIWKVSQMRLV